MRPLQTYIGNPGEDRVAQIVERCEKAISRGLEWLAGRVSAEGELEGSETVLFGYYKALLTFTAAGRYLEAERAARKIKRDFYKDGQFGGEQYSAATVRSEEHTSELQSLMRISYAVFCLKKKNNKSNI